MTSLKQQEDTYTKNLTFLPDAWKILIKVPDLRSALKI